jgi:acid phosphatase type 7
LSFVVCVQGCREKVDGFFTPTPGWSAFRSSDYGYMRMHAVNGTHLYLEQVSDDKDGAVIDWVWITKDTPTPKFA